MSSTIIFYNQIYPRSFVSLSILFGLKYLLIAKKYLVKTFFGQKNIWIEKYLIKKLQKIFGQKNFIKRNFWSENHLCQKTLHKINFLTKKHNQCRMYPINARDTILHIQQGTIMTKAHVKCQPD